MSCIQNTNGTFLTPRDCWCEKDKNHLCCKKFDFYKNTCINELKKNQKNIIDFINNIPQMTTDTAKQIKDLSISFKNLALSGLIGLIIYILYVLIFQKSSFFPKIDKNVSEINKAKINKILKNKK